MYDVFFLLIFLNNICLNQILLTLTLVILNDLILLVFLPANTYYTELQIKQGIWNIEFLNKNILCDPALKPFHPDHSNEGSQHTFC